MHFAFVLNRYAPETDANVNCVCNVIRVLKDQGHTVSVICGTGYVDIKEKVDGVAVYRIRKNSYSNRYESIKSAMPKKVYKCMHLIYSVFVLPLFPNVEPYYSVRLFNVLKNVDKTNKIDCVISVFRPFSAVAAGIKFKKKNPQTRLVLYYLDVLRGAVKPFCIPQNAYDYICNKKEHKIFTKSDLVLMAENGRIYYGDNVNFPTGNIKYVNFPTLIIDKNKKENKNLISEQKTTLVYAGYLDKDYRNPVGFFNIIDELSCSGEEISFDIYGSSNMDATIEEYAKQSKGAINYYGRVPKQLADEKLRNANCIVNFGNSTPGIVPSKVFEIISTKKKVIHVCFSKEDSSLQYFEKYPNVCVLNIWEDKKENQEKILDFLSEKTKEVTNEYLMQNFSSALPETVASFLCERGAER